MINATPTLSDRILAAIREIIRGELPQMTYTGIWEYQVTSVSGNLIDGQPTTSIPLPSLVKVQPICNPAGAVILPKVGSRVYVCFVNQDPTRPRIIAYDDTTPDSITLPVNNSMQLADGTATVIRVGDRISLDPITGQISFTPFSDRSKVKA